MTAKSDSGLKKQSGQNTYVCVTVFVSQTHKVECSFLKVNEDYLVGLMGPYGGNR